MKGEFRIALISMPFFSSRRPSIQLGLLKAIGNQHGFEIDNYSFNLDFAKEIGLQVYEKICRHRGRLLGEWLFSVAAFGTRATDQDCSFLAKIYEELPFLLDEKKEDADEWLRKIISIREITIPRFLDKICDQYAWENYDVIGFTSTFQQTTASIALAAKIKNKLPDVVTIFGGANFDGDMGTELLLKNECIDYICAGEADNAFPLFLGMIKDGRKDFSVAGICSKKQAAQSPVQPGTATDLSVSPVPDYDEYFERAEQLGLISPDEFKKIDIPFESSRGCWWGHKHHCVFCGLNGSVMQFRRKPAENVFSEISHQAKRYHSFSFEAVDNIIDMNYLESLFPLLTEKGYSFNFFYETKANLTKTQIRLLSEAGVKRIQPGIESFSPHVLKIMDKGVRAIHNVFLLKWALYYDMNVMWNIIWGFPGEEEQDYQQQQAVISKITHFQPPVGGFRIWLERFSPLFFDDKKYRKKLKVPDISYGYIFPEDHDLERIAYFFHFEFENELPAGFYNGISGEIERWKDRWRHPDKPALVLRMSDDYIEITDTRARGTSKNLHYTDEAARIYLFCHENYRHIDVILREFKDVNEDTIRSTLQVFCDEEIMLVIDDYYLSLAIPHKYEFKHYADIN